MLDSVVKKQSEKCYIAQSSHWVRAPHGGCIRVKVKLGDIIGEGDLLGIVSNPYDNERIEINSKSKGVVIGLSKIPLVNKGDAFVHIASPESKVVRGGIDYSNYVDEEGD